MPTKTGLQAIKDIVNSITQEPYKANASSPYEMRDAIKNAAINSIFHLGSFFNDPSLDFLLGGAVPLPKNSAEITQLFYKYLGNVQRGTPENAMLNVQKIMGGGILNPVVEHVGDLTHRMTEPVTEYNRGYEYVKDKVDKTLRWLTNKYGFRREMEENIINNANYHKIDPEEYKKNIHLALKKYAEEHSKLPAFNRVQELARDAAIDIGNQKFESAADKLKILKEVYLESPEKWKAKASELDPFRFQEWADR